MDKTNSFTSNFKARDVWRLAAKLALFMPLLLAVAAVNICIDPGGIYKGYVNKYQRYEYQVSREMARGKNIRALHPIDDRLLQKYFIENFSSPPDVVVLGSSRSYWLGENIFPGKKVINNSLSGVELMDYLGIFDIYARKNLYPKRVVMLLDPQLIGSPILYDQWGSIKEEAYGMLDLLGIYSGRIQQPLIPPAWLNVFSFSYFQRAVGQWGHRSPRQANLMDENIPDEQVLFKDGRRWMPWQLHSWGVEKAAIKELLGKSPQEPLFADLDKALGEAGTLRSPNSSKTIRGINHGTVMKIMHYQMRSDKRLEDTLETFIRYLMKRNIQVTLCLLPYHPELYNGFVEINKSPGALDIIGVEHYYRDMARRLGLTMVGSYDPAACGLDGKDFYDGDHLRDDILEETLKSKGSVCSMPGL